MLPHLLDDSTPARSTGRLRDEWGPMIRLSLPVILAELGWMAMGVVDTAMVGGLGPEAIGAVSIGGNLHFAVAIFGLGVLYGLDPLVSQAFGSGRMEEGRRSLIQGLYLSALMTPILMAIQYGLADRLPALGVSPAVATIAGPYMKAMAWGTLPLLVLGAFRRYLQAVNAVRPIFWTAVSANLVNWGANWLLIRGHWGLPAMGVEGSGWSTTLARVYMAAAMAGAAVLLERKDVRAFWRVPLGVDWGRMARLVRLGLPAATQITLEVGVFATATVLAGRLPAESLAAHQIALNVASVMFMIPLGISSAGAVRVGHAIGRRDPRGAASSGWAAIALGVGVMAASGLTLILIPRALASGFTEDAETLAMAATLLRVAACFQLFDGFQVVTTGVLRGAGDTRTAMVVGLVAHWGIGLPVGAWLGLGRGWGVLGLWIGLSVGLIAAAVVLLAAWLRLVARLVEGGKLDPSEPPRLALAGGRQASSPR